MRGGSDVARRDAGGRSSRPVGACLEQGAKRRQTADLLSNELKGVPDATAVALYRGLHFAANRDGAKYDEEVARQLVNAPQVPTQRMR